MQFNRDQFMEEGYLVQAGGHPTGGVGGFTRRL